MLRIGESRIFILKETDQQGFTYNRLRAGSKTFICANRKKYDNCKARVVEREDGTIEIKIRHEHPRPVNIEEQVALKNEVEGLAKVHRHDYASQVVSKAALS